MDRAFQLAANVEPRHVAMGLPMQPLTLGHVFLAHELDLPFFTHSGTPAVADLLTAVWICAWRSAPAARRSLFSLTGKLKLKLWGWSCRGQKLVVEAGRFHTYLSDQSIYPEVATPAPGTSRQLSAPEHWRLLAMLMADFHMSREQAIDTPLAFARALWAVEGERKGTLKLSHDDRISELWEHKRRMEGIEVN